MTPEQLAEIRARAEASFRALSDDVIAPLDYIEELQALDAFESAIRASERAKYAALVEAATVYAGQWADEYRGLGYGNCSGCGAYVSWSALGGSPPEIAVRHEPNCPAVALASALAALQSKEGTNE